jgi:uncharacterized membrane protein
MKGREMVQKQGNTTTEEGKNEVKENFSNFVSPKKSGWFWIAICLTALAFVSILLIPETGTALSYIRYIFAFIMVAVLPGYCLTQTLFPREEQMDTIERTTFSIGLSFAITALVGLFLSYSPFGLTLATSLPALGSLVIVLAVLALIRKYTTQ